MLSIFKMLVQLSPVSQSSTLCDPWTAAHQAPLPMGFSRQELWSGLPCLPPGDLLKPGIKPKSPALQVYSLPSEPPEKPRSTGVGRLSLLQGISLTKETNQGLLHFSQILYQLSYLGIPSPAVLMVNSVYTALSYWESDPAPSVVCTLAAEWRHTRHHGPWCPSQATPALPPRPHCRCSQPRSPITHPGAVPAPVPHKPGVGWGLLKEEEGRVAIEVCLLPCGRMHGNQGTALEQGAWDRGRGKASLKRPRTQLGHDA